MQESFQMTHGLYARLHGGVQARRDFSFGGFSVSGEDGRVKTLKGVERSTLLMKTLGKTRGWFYELNFVDRKHPTCQETVIHNA